MGDGSTGGYKAKVIGLSTKGKIAAAAGAGAGAYAVGKMREDPPGTPSSSTSLPSPSPTPSGPALKSRVGESPSSHGKMRFGSRGKKHTFDPGMLLQKGTPVKRPRQEGLKQPSVRKKAPTWEWNLYYRRQGY